MTIQSDKTHILQPAQPCTIHTDEISHDEWNKTVGKGGFSVSFSVPTSATDDEFNKQFINHLRDPQVHMSYRITCLIFGDRHLPRKLKKAHRRGPFYRRKTKWKRRLSCIALRQEVEFVGRMCSSERTPDGNTWNFTIKSEPQD